MKVAIIGAGIGGLAAAALLSKDGHKVTIYEQQNELFGRAYYFKEKGFTFDGGPSWYLMPEVFERFFNHFGEQTSDYYGLKRLSPAYKAFYQYRNPITITGDLRKDAQLFEDVESGAGDKLHDYISSAEKVYKTSVNDILYDPKIGLGRLICSTTVSTKSRLLPLLLQNLDRFVSKRFSSLELRQILEYPAVFLGATPFRTPALFHLMSYLDFKQGVFYPIGGINQVLKAVRTLALNEGVEIKTNAQVKKIHTKNKIVSGVTVNGVFEPADIVVSNADLHFTETSLLTEDEASYPKAYWRKRTAGPSALLLYLGLDKIYPELEHHSLFFAQDWRGNFDAIFNTRTLPKAPSFYICRPSATDKNVAPKGKDNIFVLVPLPAKILTKGEYQKYVQKIYKIIENNIGLKNFKKHVVYEKHFTPIDFKNRYNAWEGTALGMSHTLGQSAMFRPNVKSKKVRGLYYVGAGAQPGIGLPMCLISAEHVRARVEKDYK